MLLCGWGVRDRSGIGMAVAQRIGEKSNEMEDWGEGVERITGVEGVNDSLTRDSSNLLVCDVDFVLEITIR